MGIPQETVMKILVDHEKNECKLLLLSCYPFPVDLLPCICFTSRFYYVDCNINLLDVGSVVIHILLQREGYFVAGH